MGIDWSTFLLEIANFLILLWILKRFVYRPVKQAIEARRRRVEAALADAETARGEAETMRKEVEARELDLGRERTEARAELERSLGAERERRLAELREELQRERDKAAALAERERVEIERRSQESALEMAAGFASRLLGAVASAAVEERLIDLVLQALPSLDEERRQALAAALEDTETKVRVRTAYPLSDKHREALAGALAKAAGRTVPCEFAEDPALMAGVQIDAGPMLLGANLRDELRFFAETPA
jgi:F-type H+-transporting ATPase subunit b